MKNFLFLLLLAVAFVSCEKTPKSDCYENNPLTELNWLKQMNDSLSCTENIGVVLFEGKYSGETVFFTIPFCDVCGMVFLVDIRNCSGKVIKTYRDEEKLRKEVTGWKVLKDCNERGAFWIEFYK